MSPRRPQRPPQQVGALVARVLGDLGLDASARVVRLAERWEEAVGREVASHCRPTALYGEELEVTVDRELRRLYRQHLQRSLDDMAAFCRRRGVEYLRASTAIGFEDIVLKYLRQGVHLR